MARILANRASASKGRIALVSAAGLVALFPKTHGWAYAQWSYDSATDTFKPSDLDPSGPECGFACHTVVAAQDYIFTAYSKR